MKNIDISDDDLYRLSQVAEDHILDTIYNDDTILEHTFSNEFENKMKDLIKTEKKSNIRKYFRYGSKIAIILLITFSCIFTLSLNVEAVRTKIIQIIKEINLEFTLFRFLNDDKDSQLNFYEPQYISKGFIEINREYTSSGMLITYENSDLLQIGYEVNKINNDALILDTENAFVENVVINGIEAKYIQKNNLQQLFWYDKGSTYLIYKDLPTDEILEKYKSELIKIGESISFF